VAVHALLRVETLPSKIWEPACGPGNIVRVLRAAGHTVYASDLHDYNNCGKSGLDFLKCDSEFRTLADAIVTNPPYQWAQAFVEKALEMSPLVIMLMRLAFYESDRRRHILENCGLARIHVFRKRLPMMHRKDWEGPKANSGMAFGWFVWDRNHTGPTTIDRISWEE
jgi:predicted RNA methylase